jgi:hypothetical protein
MGPTAQRDGNGNPARYWAKAGKQVRTLGTHSSFLEKRIRKGNVEILTINEPVYEVDRHTTRQDWYLMLYVDACQLLYRHANWMEDGVLACNMTGRLRCELSMITNNPDGVNIYIRPHQPAIESL